MRLSRIWRILQIKEGVIHRGRRSRWITPSLISTTFTDTEVNNCFSIYHTSWITSGPKSNFIRENIATKAILFFIGCSEVNSTWLITSKLANQPTRKVLFTCVVYTNVYYEVVKIVLIYMYRIFIHIHISMEGIIFLIKTRAPGENQFNFVHFIHFLEMSPAPPQEFAILLLGEYGYWAVKQNCAAFVRFCVGYRLYIL